MSPELLLSTTARRTLPPAINDLMARALANPALISLAAGFVDAATLPVADVARLSRHVLSDEARGRRALQYGSTLGDPTLRARLISRLESEEGLPGGSLGEAIDRTVVTNGSQQLLYLLGEVLLDPGDIVLVESPCYFVFMGLLEGRGARVIGIETDRGGLRLDRLEATFQALEAEGALDRVKLVYTVAEHSNPSGLSLAPERRGALVELVKAWSKHHTIYLLEDAAYRGLSFDGPDAPSLLAHDSEGEHVIHTRTFSKTFSPGFKLGWGILPATLIDAVVNIKGNHDFGTSNLNQMIMDAALADGTYDRHVAMLRERYRRKRDVTIEALEAYVGPLHPEIRWTQPHGGMYVWLTLPEGIDTGQDGPLFPRCVQSGVLYVPGVHAFPEEPMTPPRHHARLSFGVPEPDDITEGVRRLGETLKTCLPSAAPARSS